MTIIVIGAGVIGCAVAHALASKGARVQVLDGREPGMGASQASAGILAPSIDERSSDLMRLTRSSLGMYESFMARVRAESGMSVEYERRGMLKIALTDEDADALAAQAADLFEVGIAHSFLLRGDARTEEPALTDAVVAGLLVPAYGYVSVRTLVDALVAAAQRAGATFTRTQVDAIRPGASGVSVTTAEGSIDADAVVVTAGSWASSLLGTAVEGIRPIRGQLLYLSAGERPVSRVIYGSRCYLVPWRDGTVLAGATVEDVGFDERPTPEGIDELHDAAAALVPSLADAPIDGVRVGLRPRGRRESPVIGAVPGLPHVFCAVGHYRNGVILTPLTAALIADLVLDGRERPELALVRPDRAVSLDGHHP